MASSSITIGQQPNGITSAYRPVIFKVLTSTVAPEMQIRAELFARNNLANPIVQVATKYEKKYLGQEYFIFDFSNILQAMLSIDRNIVSTPAFVSPNINSIVEYKVRFTEIYYNGSGITTAYNFIMSEALKAVNAIPQHEDNQTLADYILTATGGSILDGFDSGFSSEFI